MDRALVHFELFVRHGRAPWTLALATEDRRAAFEAVDEVSAGNPDASVRLLKETRDPATGEFRPLVLLERGVKPEPRRRSLGPARARTSFTPIRRPTCVQPQDLYGAPARQAIGRHLAAWLARNEATPFELLHRADLAERLEACQADYLAALSSAALEQAGAPGEGMEAIRRGLETLARRTIERIVRGDPDASFQLGVAVAARLGRCEGWGEKTAVLLDLLDAAPGDGSTAQAIVRLLQQPLVDILGGHGDLAEVFGERLALGDQTIVLLQIALAPAAATALAESPSLARLARPLSGLPARLALALHARPALARTRWAIVRRVVAALAGDGLLWPDNPSREIEGLRALAALLSRAGRLADPHDVTEALASRWRRVARPEIVQARLTQCDGPVDQAETLLDLIEDAIGRTPAAFLGQRLITALTDRAFERELRVHGNGADAILAHLAGRARSGALPPELRAEVEARLGRLAARDSAHKVTWL